MNGKRETGNDHLVTITLDGHDIQVPDGRNLLQAILETGVDLPYFCWHPALGAVGACRQCAITKYQDDKDEHGRVDMACMTPCSDGLRITVNDESSAAMRKAVIEFLMTNHPHDCPVCEEGGECHLQDMTIMAGHAYRRFHGLKRTHRNQELGPFIGHEMNRCIACYRCVRFYKDYAGGTDLDVFGAHNHVYFGRAEDGTLESPFAGNLAEVCPTGVFTDKPLSQHYTRKWDLQSAPGICAHCAVGCNTLPGERYGRLKRVWNRYHGELNGYFLCDRGRFGHGFVSDEQRPTVPWVRDGEARTELDGKAAIQRLAEALGDEAVAGVGSPRASLEANHALRALVGESAFHAGIGARQAAVESALADLRVAGDSIASLREAERADAVLVLGEPLGHTAPRLALAVRQSTRQAGFEMARKLRLHDWQDAAVRTLAQDTRSPLILATPAADELADVAATAITGSADRIAAFGQAIAAALNGDAVDDEDARAAAEALRQAKRPLVIAGSALASVEVVDAAATVVDALRRDEASVSVATVWPEANSAGAQQFGGEPLDALFAAIAAGKVRTLIVVENDLYRRAPKAGVDAALDALDTLVVIDSIDTPTGQRADLWLPAGSFAEADGTFVNYEGRAQRHFQTFQPIDSEVRESWRWLQRAAAKAGRDTLGQGLDALTRGCAEAEPALAGIVDAAPGADWRDTGLPIPRQSHRYSGRTAMHADRTMHEPAPHADADAPLAFSMEGASPVRERPAAAIPIQWAPRWNSVQAVNKFQDEIAGPLHGGDPGVKLFTPLRNGDGVRSPENGDRPRFSAGDGALPALPLHNIFGSEELSQRSSPVRERAGDHTVRLHPDTAAAAGLADAGRCRLSINGESAEFELRLDDSLPAGHVGVPIGCPGMPYVEAGDPVEIAPDGAA